jgi:protein arginine kinase
MSSMESFEIKGGFPELVASTRVRLARNVKGYAYRGLNPQQIKEIADKVWDALQTAPAIANLFTRTEVRANSSEGKALVERHLISPALAASGGWLIHSQNGGAAIMIGEEDHIRLQIMGGGLCPKECMEEARRLCALIESQVPVDYDETLGYLTACPSNLGTGLRASVMLHLPLLTAANSIQQLMNWAGRQGFTIRGAYGEGSQAAGDLYQLSNQITLGLSEDAIVEKLIRAATEVIEAEKKAREQARSANEPALADQICRAAGVLQTARLISSDEATQCLSRVLLGLQMGYLSGVTPSAVCEMEQQIRPAVLGGTAAERDSRRAQRLRDFASQLQIR